MVHSIKLRHSSISFLVLASGVFIVASLVCLNRSSAKAPEADKTNEAGESARSAEVAGAYGKLPLSFEANLGQAEKAARFIARGAGYALFLTSNETVLALRSGSSGPTEADPGTRPSEAYKVLRMKLVGAQSRPEISGLDELPGKLNYFIGNDQSKWRKDVPAYSSVRYRNAYPGIDVVYHGRQGQLEYDFVIAPGTSPRRIKMAFRGMESIAVDCDGSLVLRTAPGEVRQPKPIAYQEVDGERREVAVRYQLRNKKVSFEVGTYDKDQTLIIDPVLIYSTFLGGTSSEQGLGIAVDAQGSAYLTGSTSSTDFPVAGAFQNIKDNFSDVFVVKLNPAGTALTYSTYLGGNSSDFGNAIAVDAQGSAYVVGTTPSSNFPRTPGVLQDAKDGSIDSFVTKLSPSGSSLTYSTFLGGDNTDVATSIAISANGRAHVVGRTDSTRFRTLPFPTPRNGSPAYKSTNSAGAWAPSATGLTGSAVNGFGLDPTTANTLYAGTNVGVFKSTDAGVNWSLTGVASPSNAPQSTSVVVVDPSNPNIIYTAGVFGGVFKSTDGGILYQQKNNGLPLPPFVNTLAIDPSTPTTLYAGTQTGMFKSTNSGDNWLLVMNGIVGPLTRVSSVVIDPTNSAIVYMGTNRGMFKTTNGGALWTDINSGPLSGFTQIAALAIDPLNPSTVYASRLGGPSIFKTTDGGATWTESHFGLLTGVNALAIDPVTPATLYAATAGTGIYKSTDGGANWNPSNGGLANTSINAVAVNGSNPAIVYAGTSIGTDAFAVKLDPLGSTLEYLVNFGGSEIDQARGVGLDAEGNAYIVGSTNSQNFPVTNAFQSATGGFTDAFVSKLNNVGTAFVYSTYLGGSGFEHGSGISVRAGSPYVVGETNSPNFPVSNHFGPPPNGGSVAFVTKFNHSGASLDFSTSFGGTGVDQGLSIAVDTGGDVYITGDTSSPDFPTVEATQSALAGFTDAFVTKLNSSGTALIYSSYLGGNNSDQGNGIAVDALGDAYVIGNTSSADFPIVGAFQPTYKNFDAFVTKIAVDATTVQFTQGQYVVEEFTPSVQVNVSRSGDLSGVTTVDYGTVNGTASDRTDYTFAQGTLRFEPGEALKTFTVLFTNDALIEGLESFTLLLSSAQGAILSPPGSTNLPSSALVEIRDNDSDANAPNPIDDSRFFVRQHYHDFLNREPDAAGLNFWVDQIDSCAPAPCREVKRINVSAAFFLSIEFQQTGYLVYRVYKAAYGDVRSPSIPVPIIRLSEFLPDTQRIGQGVQVGIGNWEQQLESNKTAYLQGFVQRQRFIAEFPISLTPAQFVDKLNLNAGGVLSQAERDQLVAELSAAIDSTQGRASVVRKVAEDADMNRNETNRAFVQMQYFGYLRRNPNDAPDGDFGGWQFWLNKLNQFNGNFIDAEMVKAFITSGEYTHRFGR